MVVTIKEVHNRRDLVKFVTYPNKLYKGVKYYVPQLVSADLDTLDKNKNHAFEYCESKYWLAYNERKEIVGRIAGIINHSYNQKTGIKFARFGWLDFIDDDQVVDALFNTFENWAKENNLEVSSGPLGMLEFDASGILVDGFDELPTAYGKYNFPYYEGHLLKRGYIKDTDWVEYRVTVPEVIPEVYARVAAMISQKEKLHIAQFKNKKEIYPYLDRLFGLMNKCYSKLHGYSELSQGQIDDLRNQFLPQVNLKFLVLVLNEKDDVVGFGICLPSLSVALQKAKGKLFPFGFIHILRALKKNDVLDTLLIAIDDDYKKKGVNAIIFDYILKGIKEFGIKYVESTRELEENLSVRNLWNKFENRIHKRARCYTKNL